MAIPIALQVYSVREDLKKNFSGTLEAIAKMGYQGVEFAGDFGGLTAKDLKVKLDGLGLKACGAHIGLDQLQGDKLKATVEYHQGIGNTFLICPWIPEELRKTKEDWVKVAHTFNDINAKLKPSGMRTGYHNHGVDFKAVDGAIPWDLILSNTDASFIAQMDTGNCAQGGADPVVFLKKYPGRALSVHMKEYSASKKGALIGEGDLKWAEIISFCETAGGTLWYVIEEESGVVPPMESVRKSLDNLKKLLKR